jgi:hypothetical protein
MEGLSAIDDGLPAEKKVLALSARGWNSRIQNDAAG